MPLNQNHPTLPLNWEDRDEMLLLVAQAVNGMMKGETNNNFDVTLTASATQTTVSEAAVTIGVVPYFTPRSASAAAALANLWTESKPGSLIIHHDSSADTDRTFTVCIFG